MPQGRLCAPAAGVLAVATAAVMAVGGASAGEKLRPDDREICAQAAAAMEPLYDIPGHLLTAITLAETGRWDAERKKGYPWPWTVRAGDSGRFFDTKDDAIAELHRLRRRGVENIDVGCMQINLLYHPDAFASLQDALDPMKNAEYAAIFLKQLHERTRSWSRAVALYHSGLEDRGRGYWRRVSAFWQGARRNGYLEAQDELRSLFRREKAARAARLGYTATVGPLGTPIIRVP